MQLSKPYLWATTSTSFAIAALAASYNLSWFFWLGLLYFTLPYNLLFHGIDRLGRQSAKWLGTWLLITNGPLLGLLFALANPACRLWMAAMLLAAASYGFRLIRLKEVPLLDSLSWAFVVAAPAIFALLQSGWRVEFFPAVI